jgi:putative peptidoglycan lipid II flippase
LRLVSLWTLLSRILGFTRDAAMAGVFGLGPVLDAFTLAFRIPNLARSLFGEGALATAFLPAFVHERQTHGDDAARRLATAVLLRLAIILAALVAIAEAGLWAFRTSGNLSPYSLRLVDLLAIMTPYLLLICLAALCSAMLQALGRFGWPAAIPAALNVWWLSAVVGVAIVVVDPERRIRLVAMALLIGGAM